MTNLQVIYSVNGLIGPMTDDIIVPDEYTDDDIRTALEVILADCSEAMDRHLSIRHILLVKQQ